jgi:hypothetical protein
MKTRVFMVRGNVGDSPDMASQAITDIVNIRLYKASSESISLLVVACLTCIFVAV